VSSPTEFLISFSTSDDFLPQGTMIINTLIIGEVRSIYFLCSLAKESPKSVLLNADLFMEKPEHCFSDEFDIDCGS
jgi:hypothetical protein